MRNCNVPQSWFHSNVCFSSVAVVEGVQRLKAKESEEEEEEEVEGEEEEEEVSSSTSSEVRWGGSKQSVRLPTWIALHMYDIARE